MHRRLTLRATLGAVFLGLASCGDPSSADARIDGVDMLLVQVCQLAADCPGVSATPKDLQDCPLGISISAGPVGDCRAGAVHHLEHGTAARGA